MKNKLYTITRVGRWAITSLMCAGMVAPSGVVMATGGDAGGGDAEAGAGMGAVALGEGLKLMAVNPGYTVDEVDDVGEVILLRKMGGDDVLLAGYAINYVTAGGDSKLLREFPSDKVMIGEVLQLRLEGEAADLSYSKSLPKGGGLELLYEGKVVDSVCWRGGTIEGCKPKFTTTLRTLVRNFETDEWDFWKMADYEITYAEGALVGLEEWTAKPEPVPEPEPVPDPEPAKPDPVEPPVGEPDVVEPEVPDVEPEPDPEPEPEPTPAEPDSIEPPMEEEPIIPRPAELKFSEVLSYYATSAEEQFVEIRNHGKERVVLDGYALRYKGKTYPLTGAVAAGGYFVYRPSGFSLTKDPNSENMIELLDASGAVVDTLVYRHGQKKGVAIALLDGEWKATYAPTPGAENTYQKFQTCAEGKVINEATGNCVKVAVAAEAAPCPEGKYRNPETGRCKSYETENTEPKPCEEGYERNPETGRCRKIKTNTGADYEVLTAEAVEEQTNFVALGALGVVGTGGIGVVGWQFRSEIGEFFKKKFGRKRKF